MPPRDSTQTILKFTDTVSRNVRTLWMLALIPTVSVYQSVRKIQRRFGYVNTMYSTPRYAYIYGHGGIFRSSRVAVWAAADGDDGFWPDSGHLTINAYARILLNILGPGYMDQNHSGTVLVAVCGPSWGFTEIKNDDTYWRLQQGLRTAWLGEYIQWLLSRRYNGCRARSRTARASTWPSYP